MTSERPNQGVHISGGQVVGAVAGGPNAVAQQVTHGSVNLGGANDQLQAAQLLDLIARHRNQIAEPTFAERDAREVVEQLGLPTAERDRDRVLDALQRIARRASAVVPVVAAAEAIKSLFS